MDDDEAEMLAMVEDTMKNYDKNDPDYEEVMELLREVQRSHSK